MSILPVRNGKSIENPNENQFEFVVGERLELECSGGGTPQIDLLWSCESLETVTREATSKSCERLLHGSISNEVPFFDEFHLILSTPISFLI